MPDTINSSDSQKSNNVAGPVDWVAPNRGMKWRYLRKMEKYGLIRHTTKKYYRKIYDSVSDWIEKEIMPKIRRREARPNQSTTPP